MAKLLGIICLIILTNSLFAHDVIWPTNGWQCAKPEELGLNAGIFNSLDNKLSSDYTHIRSFLVSYQGTLVFIKYGREYSKNDFHQVCSVTKSFSSAQNGIALKNKLINDLDSKIIDLFPEYDTESLEPHFREIQLSHLLTMSPGFTINDTPFFDHSMISDKVLCTTGILFSCRG